MARPEFSGAADSGADVRLHAAALTGRTPGVCHPSAGGKAVDFLVCRKATQLLLREQQLAVSKHLEGAAAGFYELDIFGRALHEPGSRPKISRFIVSNCAVLEAKLHGCPARSALILYSQFRVAASAISSVRAAGAAPE